MQISIQSLLYKTSTCLTRPATAFFVPQMKKTYRKQPLQMGNKHKATMHKNNRLWLNLLYCYTL